MDHELRALLAALALAVVHLVGQRLRFLEGVPRSRWLSAAAGVSVAYVFLHLLPELAAGQRAASEAGGGETDGAIGFLEDEVFLAGLLGLGLFYAVEKHSAASRTGRRDAGGEDSTGAAAFRLSMASFAVYNALVGYLLLREELSELSALVLYTVALGVHFLINDFSLREHHKEAYRRVGRWLLAGAVLAGWGLGISVEISEEALALVLGLIAGGVILNVFKEEVPNERQARLLPFLAAAALYAALLQLA